MAIISEEMALRFWPDGNAVGGLLRDPDPDDADRASSSAWRPTSPYSRSVRPPGFTVYVPYTQADLFLAAFLTRTSIGPDQMVLAMVSAAGEIDPELSVFLTMTMAQHLANPRLPAQLGAFVVSMFAVLALGLAVIGLYGVVSYGVASRTHEVGIRMALGADARAVRRLLTANGGEADPSRQRGSGWPSRSWSVVCSPTCCLGLRRSIRSRSSARPLVLAATAFAAAYVPARRASRANPVTSLRAE